MNNETKNKDLIFSITSEMKLAGIPTYPVSGALKELYFCLFKNLNIPVFLIDPQSYKILDANLAAGEFLNYPLEIILRFNMNDFFVNTDIKFVFEGLKNGNSSEGKLRLKQSATGNGFYNSVSGIVNIRGNLVYFLYIENLRNINDCNTEKNVSPPFLNFYNNFVITNLAGSILTTNDNFSGIFGFSPEEILGRHINDLIPGLIIPGETKPELFSGIYKAYKRNKFPFFIKIESASFTERGKNTEDLIIYVKEVPLDKVVQNEIIRLSNVLESTGHCLNNSKVNSFVDGLSSTIPVQANKHNNPKATSVSHEFRTSLNIILGFSEILRIELKEPEYSEMAYLISDSGLKLMNIFNSIVELILKQEQKK
jgi:PAS domain-containing protein